MSSTIVHRTHIHIPWMTITVVLLAALAAAAVLVLINQPADVTVETTPVVLTAPGAAAMPQLESRAEILAFTGRIPGTLPRPAVPIRWHNFPVGAWTGSSGTDYAPTAPTIVPGTRLDFPPKTSLD